MRVVVFVDGDVVDVVDDVVYIDVFWFFWLYERFVVYGEVVYYVWVFVLVVVYVF